ncbi:MAG: CxxxxCH/CxxCH domain-containing protein [Deltaproteobacteria bacterium]|nr:CxxxxCH/CxxCH domain-containing protein [Deltaproteobacteria bacterium]
MPARKKRPALGAASRLPLAAVLFAAGILVAVSWSPASAGVSGTLHDFSKDGPYGLSTPIAASGACSGCHIPHGADPNAPIWARSLADYISGLTVNGDTAGKPNYVLPPTRACYDCHDDQSSFQNNKPTGWGFSASHTPPDIAFGTQGPRAGKTGYYENNPPSSDTYGADPSLRPLATWPTDNTALNKTGGHYFKWGDPTGSTNDTFDIGDKLPCSDCHDPHSGSGFQAFIRSNLPNSGANPGLGSSYSSVTASSFMSNNSGITRSNSESRKICVACHGYSNNGTPVKYYAINPAAYANNTDNVPRPPPSVSDHDSSATSVACVSCHDHNTVGASCSTCHGYPPPGYPAGNTPTAYSSGADSHARHRNGYAYACGVCHTGNAHQDNNVQVSFDTTILGGRLALGSSTNPSPPKRVPAGGTQCSNIYCHSSGRDGITPSSNPTHYSTVQWGVQSGQVMCDGCHGKFTVGSGGDFLADNTSMRYGAPNYVNSGAPGSATSNSHRAHVGTYECSVCHGSAFGDYNPVSRTRTISSVANHVNGTRNISFTGPALGGSVNYDSATKTCTVPSCHGGGAPQWGGSLTGCSDCHLSSSPDSDVYLNHSASNNLYDANQAGNINITEWQYSGHGKTTGTYDVSGRPAANFSGGDPCYFCHNPYALHDNTSNPFRLKDQTGAAAYLSDKGWNATCLVCHYHATAPVGYNPFGGAAVKATAAFTDNNHYGADHVAAGTNGGKLCWDCHDPHGDRPSSGVNNIYMIQGGGSRTAPAVGQLLRQSDGTYGFRGTAGTLTTNAPAFIAAATGTDYVDNTGVNRNGICQVCHTTASHWTATSGDGHNAGARCTQCHTHDSGFAPSDCRGCHGGNDGLTGAAGAPFVTRYWGDSGTTGIKSGHGRATSPAIGCGDCHDATLPGGSTHKTNNTSGTAPFNINTEHWQGKTRTADTDPNTNTSHLIAAYIGTGTDAQKQIAFDDACYSRCHQGKGISNHRHTKQSPLYMEFGRKGTTSNPKQYVWNNNGSWDYKNEFYKSWSPWTIRDLTTDATYPGSMPSTHYGTCVSCHDPHGTGITDNTVTNSGPSSGTWTNHMVRGKWKTDTAAFCNGACHRKP